MTHSIQRFTTAAILDVHARLRAYVAILFAAGLLVACSTRLESRTTQSDSGALEVVTAGSGPVTVVFESGLGADWTPWDEVASEVADHARVFAYSRPGYGASDATTAPRDPARIVHELRALLRSEGQSPPYVLVGHSTGAGYMELFAKAHPEEVIGLVLVDPRHRDFLSTCTKAGIETCGIPDSALEGLPAVERDEYVAYAQGARPDPRCRDLRGLSGLGAWGHGALDVPGLGVALAVDARDARRGDRPGQVDPLRGGRPLPAERSPPRRSAAHHRAPAAMTSAGLPQRLAR